MGKEFKKELEKLLRKSSNINIMLVNAILQFERDPSSIDHEELENLIEESSRISKKIQNITYSKFDLLNDDGMKEILKDINMRALNLNISISKYFNYKPKEF